MNERENSVLTTKLIHKPLMIDPSDNRIQVNTC